MNFINKLENTFELLNNLDGVVTKGADKKLLKNQLLSVSNDLSSYKDLDKENAEYDNDEIKSKIIDLLNKINEIEINVKNKIIITEKYNSYLNS